MEEERIIALETKVTYLELALKDLNEVIVDQQKALADQAELMDHLRQSYREMKDVLGGEPLEDKKPPHY